MEFIGLKEESIIDSRESKRQFHNFVHNSKIISDKSKGKVLRKCGEIFIDEDDLLNFLCTLCDNSFEQIEKFFVHIKECTTIKQEDPLNLNDDGEFRDLKNEPKVQIIAIDGIEENLREDGREKLNTYSVANTQKHKENNGKMVKDGLNEQNPNTDCEVAITRKEDLIKSYETRPICNICGKSFASLKSLRRHQKVINCCMNKVEKPFVCEICGTHFSSKRSLRRHQNIRSCEHRKTTDTANPNDDPTKCRYCDRRLQDSSTRVEHERIHTGEKPFQCQICGKCFRTLANCTVHEQLHTTERLFKCEICNVAFKNKKTLYNHNQRHGEKIFQCSYCEKSFYQRSERKQHERYHTGEKPYKCTTCGRAFQTSGNLQNHKRRHLNIRPFKCEYCGSCFFTKEMLKNHIVIHTGERPFVCTICNATFPRRKGLKSHEKIHSDLPKYVCAT